MVHASAACHIGITLSHDACCSVQARYWFNPPNTSGRDQRQTYPPKGTDRDSDERRCLPDGEKDEPDQRQREISRSLHSVRPDWIIKCSAKKADHRRVDAPHERLRVGAL